MNKTVILTNEEFSWTLRVDDHFISFQGAVNADYFEDHYRALGYDVIRVNDQQIAIQN